MLGVAFEVPNLRRDHEVLRPQTESHDNASEHSFRAAVAVDIGVVEVIDAGVHGTLDRSGHFVFIDVRPSVRDAVDKVEPSHRPTAKADFGDADVCIAESAIVHRRSAGYRVPGTG